MEVSAVMSLFVTTGVSCALRTESSRMILLSEVSGTACAMQPCELSIALTSTSNIKTSWFIGFFKWLLLKRFKVKLWKG
jgi:hypothetical protein